MKLLNSNMPGTLVTLGALFISFAGIGIGNAGTIRIDGSSTVYPITEAVAEDFQIAKRGKARVTVGISGTGGGFKKFCRGEVDITNASRPIMQKEMDKCKKAGIEYVEMPVAFDALTVVIHPKNNWSKTITVAELKKMWGPAAQNKINSWNQINPAWPNAKFKLYGAGADSGTFDYFTEAIVGKSKSSRGDFTASEDDNVLVQGVSRDKNGLAFFGFAYYVENRKKLNAVAIDAGNGGVLPSYETVANGTYQPLSRPIFIYVNVKAAERPEVRDLIDFYMTKGQALVEEVKYFPLPKAVYSLNLENLDKKKVGTVFGGESKMGMKIEDVMKLEHKK
ncbi:MAG: PstS family phosphate ABC transporter substrate-binding protein [Nitrosomonadaceae bacterium]|jgi:phosphate transport system substrate-binding protein|nr:PstS family phosphate ABC transporter substrate-binding protein [Nitrosomonadaceae bacterium]